jgi:activator of HSP90 ATPase
MESIKVFATFPVSPGRIYEAWLNSKEHSAFTGGLARASGKVGGAFSAWDGYIKGKNLILEPNRRIVQSWRTSEFPERSGDSRLEVLLEELEKGTRVTLIHINIPDGQGEMYKEGWRDNYFKPMKRYFKEA